MCHKRCVPALDFYWENLEKCLLARFEYVCHLNIQSIRDCDPSKFQPEMGPHYVSVFEKQTTLRIQGVSS